MIIGIYYIVVEIGGPQAWKGYNYWAVLILDILSVVFWLVSFALMAARIAPFADGIVICGVYECITYALEGDYLTLFACSAAVAGIGGLELYVFFSFSLFRLSRPPSCNILLSLLKMMMKSGKVFFVVQSCPDILADFLTPFQ